MKLVKATFIAGLMLAQTTQAANLTIAADLSTSTTHIIDKTYAQAVGAAVAAKVKTLQLGDRVYFKTFGTSETHHLKSKPLLINRKMRPERAAELVENRISRLPSTVKGEGSTNLLAFLENGHFHCDEDGSAVWLLTDGIESSIDFDGMELLKGKPLPAPYKQTLTGCDVVMIGVGRIGSRKMTRKDTHVLNKAWTDWLIAAGAKSVDILVDPKL